jgi:hypothetical protein
MDHVTFWASRNFFWSTAILFATGRTRGGEPADLKDNGQQLCWVYSQNGYVLIKGWMHGFPITIIDCPES